MSVKSLVWFSRENWNGWWTPVGLCYHACSTSLAAIISSHKIAVILKPVMYWHCHVIYTGRGRAFRQIAQPLCVGSKDGLPKKSLVISMLYMDKTRWRLGQRFRLGEGRVCFLFFSILSCHINCTTISVTRNDSRTIWPQFFQIILLEDCIELI